MKKIYGFREKDVIGLAEFIKNRKGEPLVEIFNQYALQSKKASGTIRNLYYALAKFSAQDENFKNKYLNGVSISVEKREEFSSEQEREIIKKILLKKKEGYSIRKSINLLTGGDEKKALRYQNKYRAVVKNKPELINSIVEEIRRETKDETFGIYKPKAQIKINEVQYNRLKKEINNLLDRCTLSIKKENLTLKAKLIEYEQRINTLQTILYGENGKTVKDYFHVINKDKYLS